MEAMKYTASMDTPVVIITTCTTILFAAVIVVQYTVQETVMPSIISLLLAGIYLFIFLLKPVYYFVDSHQLVIHRLLNNVVIERSRISTVSLLDIKEIRGSVRTFGVGGLFGYFGRFYRYGIGSMTWYATRRNHLVLIVTHDGQKIIVTPDDTATFISELSP
jgi:hypothetical protein